MLDDEVRLRQATTEDAEEIRDVAWQSMEYLELDADEMNEFREILDISPSLIENNVAYAAENSETEEILGFYIIERSGEEFLLRYLCVSPDYMGTGIGETLFLNACEMAEEAGAEKLYIICHKNNIEFYAGMGAGQCGEYAVEINGRSVIFQKLQLQLCSEE